MQFPRAIPAALLWIQVAWASALYLGPFVPHGESRNAAWVHAGVGLESDSVQIFVGIKNQLSHDEIHARLMDVSSPKSPSYGKFYSQDRVAAEVWATSETRASVAAFFQQALGPSAHLQHEGAFLEIVAPVRAVETAFATSLAWYQHSESSKRALRCTTALHHIPGNVAQHLTFLSINSPIMNLASTAVKASQRAAQVLEPSSTTLSVTPGNKEAMVSFKPLCSNGAQNQYNPPCSTDATPPVFAAVAEQFHNNRSDPYNMIADPLDFPITRTNIFCYNSYTKVCPAMLILACR